MSCLVYTLTDKQKPARLPALRPSSPSVMKPSLPHVSKSSSSSALEPLIPKPTRGELRAGVEVLARRGSLIEGSARAAKSYKAKVASLTSEKASLRAQIKDLTEELMNHRFDLKHTSTARAWAEDKEKKAQKELRVAEDELWLAREELQVVKGDLRIKVTTLDRVRQEALEARSSVERGKLQGDLVRQEALC